MPISYQAALRMLAKEKGGFTVPKKGSADYDKVRKMMGETEMSEEHSVKKRVGKGKKMTACMEAPKEAKTKAKTDVSSMDSEKQEEKRVKRVRKIRAKKEMVASSKEAKAALPASMKDVTAPIDAPQAEQMKQKKVRNAMKVPEVKVKGGVQKSGETKTEEVKDFLVNNNTGASSLITTQLAGQSKRIKESLAMKDDAGMVVDPTPEEATIDAMNKEAATVPSLQGRGQFDFIAFRRKLLC